jgi:hypothetical protein
VSPISVDSISRIELLLRLFELASGDEDVEADRCVVLAAPCEEWPPLVGRWRSCPPVAVVVCAPLAVAPCEPGMMRGWPCAPREGR